MFAYRVNIKFPSNTTIKKFYDNFNYGQYWLMQMRQALYMDQPHQIRKPNSAISVTTLADFIGTKFSNNWNQLIKRKPATNFSNEPITIIDLMNQSMGTRTTWLNQFGPRILVDFRNPHFGEPLKAMFLTDSENDNVMDADNVADDDIISDEDYDM